MPFEKGKPKTGGRKKGVVNKVTATVREAFEHAFNELQKDPNGNLLAWAKGNKTDFYKLAGKLIPADVALKGSVALRVITGVPDSEDNDVSDLL